MLAANIDDCCVCGTNVVFVAPAEDEENAAIACTMLPAADCHDVTDTSSGPCWFCWNAFAPEID